MDVFQFAAMVQAFAAMVQAHATLIESRARRINSFGPATDLDKAIELLEGRLAAAAGTVGAGPTDAKAAA